MSEVRGSGREYQTVTAQEWLRGATPCLRSGGAAERRYPASEVRGSDERSYPTSKVRGDSQEEIPHALKPEARGGGWEELPHARMSEARGSAQEEQPHARGQGWWPGGKPHAVAARAKEALQELSHVEGQEGRR